MTDRNIEFQILPMSTDNSEFQGKSYNIVQLQFFMEYLPSRGGKYVIGKKGLNAKPGTVILFQYNNEIIASAIFEEQGEDFLRFDVDSIKVFDPIGPEVFVELCPEKFKNDSFSNAKTKFSLESYSIFEQHIKNSRSPQPNLVSHDKDFEKSIQQAKKRSSEERKVQLTRAPRIPRMVKVYTTVFLRNANVVVEVLERAQGVCELCKCPAPFTRRSDGSPYLEVHHKKRLADGGEDTVENAIALCPNCHRREHYA